MVAFDSRKRINACSKKHYEVDANSWTPLPKIQAGNYNTAFINITSFPESRSFSLRVQDELVGNRIINVATDEIVEKISGVGIYKFDISDVIYFDFVGRETPVAGNIVCDIILKSATLRQNSITVDSYKKEYTLDTSKTARQHVTDVKDYNLAIIDFKGINAHTLNIFEADRELIVKDTNYVPVSSVSKDGRYYVDVTDCSEVSFSSMEAKEGSVKINVTLKHEKLKYPAELKEEYNDIDINNYYYNVVNIDKSHFCEYKHALITCTSTVKDAFIEVLDKTGNPLIVETSEGMLAENISDKTVVVNLCDVENLRIRNRDRVEGTASFKITYLKNYSSRLMLKASQKLLEKVVPVNTEELSFSIGVIRGLLKFFKYYYVMFRTSTPMSFEMRTQSSFFVEDVQYTNEEEVLLTCSDGQRGQSDWTKVIGENLSLSIKPQGKRVVGDVKIVVIGIR